MKMITISRRVRSVHNLLRRAREENLIFRSSAWVVMTYRRNCGRRVAQIRQLSRSYGKPD